MVWFCAHFWNSLLEFCETCLPRCFACCHNHCEWICTTAMLCQENTVSLNLFTPSDPSMLLPFCWDSEPWRERVCYEPSIFSLALYSLWISACRESLCSLPFTFLIRVNMCWSTGISLGVISMLCLFSRIVVLCSLPNLTYWCKHQLTIMLRILRQNCGLASHNIIYCLIGYMITGVSFLLNLNVFFLIYVLLKLQIFN